MRLDEFSRRLMEAGVSEYKKEAQIFITELFNVSSAELILNRDREYDDLVLSEIIRKREEKIPLQHIIGRWSFMGDMYKVSPDCLIPRADTEVVVERALKALNDGERVADLCTGSGCIGISILRNKPKITATLVDISGKALVIAEENARALGVIDRCEIISADVTEDILSGAYDMIISNPPYIKTSDIDGLEKEVKKEPILALDGGDDGLDIIRALLKVCPSHIKSGGYLVLEYGYDQLSEIKSLFDNEISNNVFENYEIIYDYGKNPRGIIAKKS